MKSRASHQRVRGFTLLEVLIALAIVALSAGALLGSVTSSASNVIYLKEKTLAEWVALNRLTEVRIDQNMPGEGKRKGATTMAGMRWEWEEEVTELPFEGMWRIDVRSHATGELVDDRRVSQQDNAQKLSPSASSGTGSDNVAWTTTVSGVVGSSRSDRRAPIAVSFSVDPDAQQGGPPGGAPVPQPKTGAPTT